MRDIILLTDLSPESEIAFAPAKEQLRNYPDATLHLLHVLEPTARASIDFGFGLSLLNKDAFLHEASLLAGKELGRLKSKYFDDVQVRIELLRGSDPVHAQVLQYAARLNAGMIILATHGRRGLEHLLMGSVAEKILRGAQCQVLIVRSASKGVNTVVPLDLSEDSLFTLSVAKERQAITEKQGGHTILFHVLEDIVAATYDIPLGVNTEELWEEREENAGNELEKLVTQKLGGTLAMSYVHRQRKSAAEDILDFARARDAGLIILGSHGRTGFAHSVLGSVAERVVRDAPCPVLIVPVGKR